MRIYAAAALVAYTAAIKMRAMEDDEPTDDWVDGEWQDPCAHLSPCHDIIEADPCAGDSFEDTEDWEQCHADNAEWGQELETCLKNKTEEEWAALLECAEEHPIDDGSSGDDLAQESLSADDVDSSNWESGEWQDPCEREAPCKEIIEADPCGEFASDSDAWEECHEGTEGQEWAAELEECLASKDTEDWGDLLHCAEEEISVPSDVGDDLAQTSGDDTSGDDTSGDDTSGDDWSSGDDLAQESEIGSDWSDGEWQDPCRHLAPCAEFFENDPCEGEDDWSACHEGEEGQAWAAELETCLDNKTKEQWEAEFQCWEEHPIEE